MIRTNYISHVLFILYTWLLIVFVESKYQHDLKEISQIIEEGRSEYNLLQERSNFPQYGSCWKDSVLFLRDGCKSLTDDVQSDIALKFTDCFLEMSGHKTYKCEIKPDKSECLKSMSDRAFNVYTEFYTHTHNICFFLESQVWHEETEKTINRLSTSSARVTKQLEEAETVQTMLLEQQKESMSVQQKLLDNGISLSEVLHASQDNLHEIMQEFRISTIEQKTMLLDVFDRLASLQAWAIGEMSWLDTIIFYVSCIIISYIITATPRTHEARIWIFLTVTINAIFERAIVTYLLEGNAQHIDVVNDNLNWWIWLCRKLMLAVCIVWIGIAVCTYVDYNAVNHKLLLTIQQQNIEVIQHLEKTKGLVTLSSNNSSVVESSMTLSQSVNAVKENHVLQNGKLPTTYPSAFSALPRTDNDSESSKSSEENRISSLPKLRIIEELISPPSRPSSRSSTRSTRSRIESTPDSSLETRSTPSRYSLRHLTRISSTEVSPKMNV